MHHQAESLRSIEMMAGGADPLADVVLRLRSDTGITLVDGAVSQRASTVGGHLATQGSAGARPGFTASNAAFNGRPSVDPDATDDWMLLPHDAAFSINAATGWYTAVVLATASAQSLQDILTKWVGTQREWILQMVDGAPRMFVRRASDTANVQVVWGSDIRDGAPHLVEFFFDHVAEQVGIAVDGAADERQGSTVRTDTGDVHLYQLGTRAGPDIQEPDIAMLPYMPIAAHRGEIRAALAAEYGVTLA
jgi:hypothetical protein